MLATILSAIVVGAIIGAVARLVMPGQQNISVLMTILLGAAGSLVGSWLSVTLLNASGSAFALIPFLLGVLMAVIFIAVYIKFTGGRAATTV